MPTWAKSSRSLTNGTCVEVAWVSSSHCSSGSCVEVARVTSSEGEPMTDWTKSSYCGTNGCVEVAWTKSSHCADSACVEVAWRKSSACSGGACVEVGWRTSSYSAGGNCVEVAEQGVEVLVRDSKDPDGPRLSFTQAEWDAFLNGPQSADDEGGPGMLTEDWRKSTRSGPHDGQCVECRRADTDAVQVRDSKHPDGPVLSFTPAEWDAFVLGVQDGEFG